MPGRAMEVAGDVSRGPRCSSGLLAPPTVARARQLHRPGDRPGPDLAKVATKDSAWLR